MQETREISLQRVDEIANRYDSEKESLIQVLQDISSEYGYLPEPCLRRVTEKLDIPLSDVFAAATFYKAFSLEPRGRHLIRVCLGTACHVRGASQVLSKIERRLSIEAGQTSRDLMFTLKIVNCLGACALGPVVMVDGEYHGQMTQAKVDRLLDRYTEAAGGKHDPEKS
ncbi:hypothetical protein ES707_08997 [subsurface metagenome]